MSPRKSSISSGKPPHRRPRYLGLVAQRDGPGSISSRDWDGLLRHLLSAAGHSGLRFRVVRSEGGKALVEVEHTDVVDALACWAPAAGNDDLLPALRLRSTKTWGTLRKAKAWLQTRTDGTAASV